MNRNLLTLAALLILLGLGFNFYLLAFFGLILLIPAFMSASRPTIRRAPVQSRQEMRRITPPIIHPPETAPTAPQPKAVVSMPAPVQTQTYSPSLFPTSMFPAHTQLGTSPAPTKEPPTQKPGERDELVEVGTILVLMKLVFG